MSSFKSICFTDWSYNLFSFKIISLGFEFLIFPVILHFCTSPLMLYLLYINCIFSIFRGRGVRFLIAFLVSLVFPSCSEVCNTTLKLIRLVISISCFFFTCILSPAHANILPLKRFYHVCQWERSGKAKYSDNVRSVIISIWSNSTCNKCYTNSDVKKSTVHLEYTY